MHAFIEQTESQESYMVADSIYAKVWGVQNQHFALENSG